MAHTTPSLHTPLPCAGVRSVERATTHVLSGLVMGAALGLSACCGFDDTTPEGDAFEAFPAPEPSATLDVQANVCGVVTRYCTTLSSSNRRAVSEQVELRFQLATERGDLVRVRVELSSPEDDTAPPAVLASWETTNATRTATLNTTIDATSLVLGERYDITLYAELEPDALGSVNRLHSFSYGLRPASCTPEFSVTHPDTSVDGEDQDCDGLDGPDLDQDGIAGAGGGGTDCDDADPARGACDFGLSCQPSQQACVCAPPHCTPGSPDDYAAPARLTFFDDVVVRSGRVVSDDPYSDMPLPNHYGETFRNLFRLVDIDVNDTIADRIRAGDFAVGAVWRGTADAPELIDLVSLDPAGRETSDAFTLTRDTFVPGSSVPYGRFDSFETGLDATRFRAHASSAVLVPFPFGDTTLNLLVRDATLDGVLADPTSDTPTIAAATLHGSLRSLDILSAFDAYLRAPLCDCLNVPVEERPSLVRHALDKQRQQQPSDACVGPPEGVCDEDEASELCQTIVAVCDILTVLLDEPEGDDADTGVVFALQGTPAECLGVTPDAAP